MYLCVHVPALQIMSYCFSLQMLWKQVHNYPMFNLLMDIDSYMFACVNQTAVYEELEDETRRLCDVRPFLPVLKLVTRSCDPAEKLDSKIGVLIGKGNLKSFQYEVSPLSLFCVLTCNYILRYYFRHFVMD